ncbi:MAG: phospho-N-acetylmuramoyl-pentapeptide-transferase [Acidobacteriota bacterium]|nr:phospho-N-acetylmuramoyl-pentapeptide-transferase [Acidobacteriota bacterium]
MLYHLLFPLRDSIAALNVVRYITFRAAGAALMALVIALILGPWAIRTLRRLSVGQTIREEGPQSHREKEGTPTMGGLLILFSLTVTTLLWARLDNPYVWLTVGTALAFGAIGFADDYLKVVRRHNRGLSAMVKLAAQVVVGAVFGWVLLSVAFEPTLTFPFFKDLVIDLGVLYVPFVILILAGFSNAVNLTDGLDGLAIGATLIAAAAYAIFTYIAGHRIVSEYLQVSYQPGVGELAIFCSALVGASLGFLWFNSHPAEVFMGDVGALAIGGAIAAVAILSKQELLLFFVMGLFLMELGSVVIQVASFKLTGKRVFRMAPIHHHFELAGWKESQIVVRFWILAILFALLSLSTLKLR